MMLTVKERRELEWEREQEWRHDADCTLPEVETDFLSLEPEDMQTEDEYYSLPLMDEDDLLEIVRTHLHHNPVIDLIGAEWDERKGLMRYRYVAG